MAAPNPRRPRILARIPAGVPKGIAEEECTRLQGRQRPRGLALAAPAVSSAVGEPAASKDGGTFQIRVIDTKPLRG
jgi:hypothetical protein